MTYLRYNTGVLSDIPERLYWCIIVTYLGYNTGVLRVITLRYKTGDIPEI